MFHAFLDRNPARFVLLVLLSAAVHAQPMSGTYPVGAGRPGVDSFATVQDAAGTLNARGLGGNVEAFCTGPPRSGRGQ